MPVYLQVTCINKPDRTNPYARIQALGGVDGNGIPWYMTEDQAIATIESGQNALYTNVNGQSANVVVMQPKSLLGNKYLRTNPDTTPEDNLLYLEEC